MKTYFKQLLAQPGRLLAARNLLLSLVLLGLCLGGLRPGLAAAQDVPAGCQDVNDMLTFDYRNWGIGIHRDCKCAEGDLLCYAELPVCFALKAKQILLGEPVDAWIRVSKAAALADGVSPMPMAIRNQLDHLYPASLLDKVRYKTGSGFLGTLQWFRGEIQGKGAITLEDVIIFAEADKASNARLWAHELEHVRQYEQLGIDGFAQAYVDQTCILPGEAGYDSGRCQLERRADRKSGYWNQRGLVFCCTRPATVYIADRELTGTEEISARESITIGPNVVLKADGNIRLRAGLNITVSPGFRTEARSKLSADIDPSLNASCAAPAVAVSAPAHP
ncbi:MAG: DUF4157 domain-containing protein [Acidobacteria bacterium]|nr:DUF4157 domain-containing protein [Acidobacteriota bacterium]MBI3424963.1 DUF4157 domain-containing protein [Acidobacteriota bacterium]